MVLTYGHSLLKTLQAFRLYWTYGIPRQLINRFALTAFAVREGSSEDCTERYGALVCYHLMHNLLTSTS